MNHKVMTEEQERAWRVQYAFVLRCLCRAVDRMERIGLYHDAEQIRAELATMGIDLLLIPDESNSN